MCQGRTLHFAQALLLFRRKGHIFEEQLGKVGTESDGFGTQDLEANTEFRHSAISCAVSAVQPFEVREGIRREPTPETDLISRHQDLEEGDRFESSDLR